MTPFQAIVVPVAGLLTLWSLYRALTSDTQRKIAWFGALLWATAGICVLRPDLMTAAAVLLGIGRGADLVLYAFCLAFLIFSIHILSRLRQLNSALTSVVRELALRSASDQSPRDGSQGP